MNKYLMLTAAALLGTASPAAATAYTIQFYTAAGGQAYCDGMAFKKIYINLPFVFGQHLNEDCGGNNPQVFGVVTGSKYILAEGPYSEQLFYDIYKPIQNGKPWDLYVCFSGTTCFEANSGVYMKGFSGARHGGISTRTRVAEMIAARKAALVKGSP